jgi:hypothetical protein
MKNLFKISGIVAILVLLSGCAVPKASIELENKAKGLSAPADKALIYIVRPDFLGSAIKFTVECDGTRIGATGGKRFIYTIQSPGKHKIVSRAENDAEIEVEVEAGKIYYVQQIPTMGVMKARNKLVLLNETEGKEKLGKSNLSTDCVEK